MLIPHANNFHSSMSKGRITHFSSILSRPVTIDITTQIVYAVIQVSRWTHQNIASVNFSIFLSLLLIPLKHHKLSMLKSRFLVEPIKILQVLISQFVLIPCPVNLSNFFIYECLRLLYQASPSESIYSLTLSAISIHWGPWVCNPQPAPCIMHLITCHMPAQLGLLTIAKW